MAIGKFSAEAAKKLAKEFIKELIEQLIKMGRDKALTGTAHWAASYTGDIQAELRKRGRALERQVERLCSAPNIGLAQALAIRAVIPALGAYATIDPIERMQVCSNMLDIIQMTVEHEYGKYARRLGSAGRGAQNFNIVFGVGESWVLAIDWAPIYAKLGRRLGALVREVEDRKKAAEAERRAAAAAREKDRTARRERWIATEAALKKAYGTPQLAQVAAARGVDQRKATGIARFGVDPSTGEVTYPRKKGRLVLPKSDRRALVEAFRKGAWPALNAKEAELGLRNNDSWGAIAKEALAGKR